MGAIVALIIFLLFVIALFSYFHYDDRKHRNWEVA